VLEFKYIIREDITMSKIVLLSTKFINDPADFGIGGLCFGSTGYCRGIMRAGAEPIIAAMGSAEVYADIADAILFTGGADWNPRRYGAQNEKNIKYNNDLDALELALFEAFYKRKKPMFGICRGIQTINVAMGGTLWQDIPSQVEGKHSQAMEHYVNSTKGSIMNELFGDRFLTNSHHHQAVKECGEGLRATAFSDNGVIEAIEHESLPIFAVQWHPERMIGDENFHMTDMIPLFKRFVDMIPNK